VNRATPFVLIVVGAYLVLGGLLVQAAQMAVKARHVHTVDCWDH